MDHLPRLEVGKVLIDGLEQFEQISESQLLQYLRDGWLLVHKVENGEVIVKR